MFFVLLCDLSGVDMSFIWRLIVSLCLGCFSLSAAAVIPMGDPWDTSTCNASMYQQDIGGTNGGAWECQAGTGSNPMVRNCGVKYPNGYFSSKCTQEAVNPVCPPHSTGVGNVCVCTQGYEEVGGSCQQIGANADRDTCAAFGIANTLPGGTLVQDYRIPGNIADGAVYCMPGAFPSDSKGCKVTFSRDAFLDYGGGSSITEGTFSMSPNASTIDQSCNVGSSDSPPKVPTPDKCKTGFTGTVNGVEVCVNKVPDSGVGNNKEEETTDTENETKKVTRDSTTECKNGVCTTTTTTTTTVTTKPDGVTTTKTSTTTSSVGQEGFCKENPGTKMCSNGDDKGVGDVGSVGRGKTHGQPDLYETKYPNGIKGVWEDSGIAGADGKFGQLASALMPSIADGNGGCLSFTVPLSVGIVDFGVLDVSPPCLIWPFIRICVLITALWLARALIFGG